MNFLSLGGVMKSSILRIGSLTILGLICLAQVMSVAIAYGNTSQGPVIPFEPPFPPSGGFLTGGPGAQYAGGPPDLRGIGRHGRARAQTKFALLTADASSIFLEAPSYSSGGSDAY